MLTQRILFCPDDRDRNALEGLNLAALRGDPDPDALAGPRRFVALSQGQARGSLSGRGHLVRGGLA